MTAPSLSEYLSKRNFDRTPEPDASSGTSGDAAVFVIQKHAASSLHYDFRLKVGDALASWAVPKGPSTDPREKRLAVRTEDHPLDYADFEGVIPEDEYGGGTVIVWDAGRFRNLMADKDEPMDMKQAIDGGHVEVWLEGEKIKGGYALVHARTGGEERNWLLVKMDDEMADARRNPVSTEPLSVLSGRSIEDVEAEGGNPE